MSKKDKQKQHLVQKAKYCSDFDFKISISSGNDFIKTISYTNYFAMFFNHLKRTYSNYSFHLKFDPLPLSLYFQESTADRQSDATIDVIAEAIAIQPELKKIQLPQLQAAFNILVVDQGFSKGQFRNIVTAYPAIVQRNPAKIVDSLECWRTTQFGDKNLFQLIDEHPQLLDFNNENHLRVKMAHLRQYAGTRNNVWRMFMYSPNVLTDTPEEINAKIKYFDEEMRADMTDVTKSTAFAHELDWIEMRHVFLVRLGLYTKRSLKSDPLEPNKNPRMHRIVDSGDEQFAAKVCGVSLEEFETFKLLYEREIR